MSFIQKLALSFLEYKRSHGHGPRRMDTCGESSKGVDDDPCTSSSGSGSARDSPGCEVSPNPFDRSSLALDNYLKVKSPLNGMEDPLPTAPPTLQWLESQDTVNTIGMSLASGDALLLRCEHWLEAADEHHRHGSNLRPYFDYWSENVSGATENARGSRPEPSPAAPSLCPLHATNPLSCAATEPASTTAQVPAQAHERPPLSSTVSLATVPAAAASLAKSPSSLRSHALRASAPGTCKPPVAPDTASAASPACACVPASAAQQQQQPQGATAGAKPADTGAAAQSKKWQPAGGWQKVLEAVAASSFLRQQQREQRPISSAPVSLSSSPSTSCTFRGVGLGFKASTTSAGKQGPGQRRQLALDRLTRDSGGPVLQGSSSLGKDLANIGRAGGEVRSGYRAPRPSACSASRQHSLPVDDRDGLIKGLRDVAAMSTLGSCRDLRSQGQVSVRSSQGEASEVEPADEVGEEASATEVSGRLQFCDDEAEGAEGGELLLLPVGAGGGGLGGDEGEEEWEEEEVEDEEEEVDGESSDYGEDMGESDLVSDSARLGLSSLSPGENGVLQCDGADPSNNFFLWLDHGPGKLLDLGGQPSGVSRAKLESERVRYLTREELPNYEVVVDKSSGLLRYKASGQLLHTFGSSSLADPAAPPAGDAAGTAGQKGGGEVDAVAQDCDAPLAAAAAAGQGGAGAGAAARRSKFPQAEAAEAEPAAKDTKWIWVVGPSGRLYVHPKVRGKFHHSSFVRGSVVLAAGNMLVDQGRLVGLTADSGHYWPKPGHFKWFYERLERQGADLQALPALDFSTKH